MEIYRCSVYKVINVHIKGAHFELVVPDNPIFFWVQKKIYQTLPDERAIDVWLNSEILLPLLPVSPVSPPFRFPSRRGWVPNNVLQYFSCSTKTFFFCKFFPKGIRGVFFVSNCPGSRSNARSKDGICPKLIRTSFICIIIIWVVRFLWRDRWRSPRSFLQNFGCSTKGHFFRNFFPQGIQGVFSVSECSGSWNNTHPTGIFFPKFINTSCIWVIRICVVRFLWRHHWRFYFIWNFCDHSPCKLRTKFYWKRVTQLFTFVHSGRWAQRSIQRAPRSNLPCFIRSICQIRPGSRQSFTILWIRRFQSSTKC